MSKTLDSLNELFEQFEDSWQGDDTRHRLDLAEIIWRGLKREGWTQRELAKASGIADADISELIHGEKNFTSSTLGKIVNALGVKVKLQESSYVAESGQESTILWFHPENGIGVQIKVKKGNTNGTTQGIKVAAETNASYRPAAAH